MIRKSFYLLTFGIYFLFPFYAYSSPSPQDVTTSYYLTRTATGFAKINSSFGKVADISVPGTVNEIKNGLRLQLVSGDFTKNGEQYGLVALNARDQNFVFIKTSAPTVSLAYIPTIKMFAYTMPSIDKIGILDAEKLKVEREITVGRYPYTVVYHNNKLLATDSLSNDVTIIDIVNNFTKTVVYTSDFPSIAVAGDGKFWVVNNHGSRVTVIDSNTNQILSEINTGYSAKEIKSIDFGDNKFFAVIDSDHQQGYDTFWIINSSDFSEQRINTPDGASFVRYGKGYKVLILTSTGGGTLYDTLYNQTTTTFNLYSQTVALSYGYNYFIINSAHNGGSATFVYYYNATLTHTHLGSNVAGGSVYGNYTINSKRVKSDYFHADGSSDLWLQNSQNELNFVVPLTPNGQENGKDFPPSPGSNFEMVGSGDFDNDGKSDAVWRDRVTGDYRNWLMNNEAIVTENRLPTVSDINYNIKGIADFNGDGFDDLVFRNKVNGFGSIWYLNASGFIVSKPLIYVSPSTGYQIAAVADFDGDKKSDILWRNYKTGENQLWVMDDNAKIRVSHSLPAVKNLDYEVVGIGYFNGHQNGAYPSFVLRNRRIGLNFLASFSDIHMISMDEIESQYDMEKKIIGVLDHNGDDFDDILWRDSVGMFEIWHMNGNNVISKVTLKTIHPNWKVRGFGIHNPNPYRGINPYSGADMYLELPKNTSFTQTHRNNYVIK